MKVEYLDRLSAQKILDEANFPDNINEESLSIEYLEIKEKIEEFDKECRQFKLYQYDLNLALKLYNYFESQSWFNNVIASNYEFWSYLSIKVAPNIIFNRHGLSPEYYYKKNVRIYFFSLYWYIHLSWQGDIQKTKKILEFNSTDTIQASVERPGKKGVFLNTFREIFRVYGLILLKESQKTQLVKNYKSIDKVVLFRRVMIKHTAKCLVIQPELYEQGIVGYVKMLFGDYHKLGE